MELAIITVATTPQIKDDPRGMELAKSALTPRGARFRRLRRFVARGGACGFAELKHLLRCRRRKEVHGPGNNPGPPCLVACPQPRSVVSMEIFIELNIFTPVRIVLKFLRTCINRPLTFVVFQE